MARLSERHCLPCRGGVPPLTAEEIRPLIAQIQGWNVVEDHHLEKTYEFPDFRRGLQFVNVVGEISEAEGHHPDIHLSWKKVGISIWTHKIDGLSESDFVLAAKIDDAYEIGPQG